MTTKTRKEIRVRERTTELIIRANHAGGYVSAYMGATEVLRFSATEMVNLVAQAFGNTALKIRDSTNAFEVSIVPGEEAADRALAIPILGGDDILMTLALAQTVAGLKTFSAGIPAPGTPFIASPRNIHTGGVPAQVSTEGTNLSAVVTEMYVAELFVPCNMTITGAAVLWGDATEGNAKIALFDATGARVALSASTDVAAYTADSYGSRIAFAAPYAAKGPATYYLGVICDSSSNRINTHILGNFGAGKITSLVYATEAGYATITPPTTFTTGLGPIATLY